jgi:hypothetical protein
MSWRPPRGTGMERPASTVVRVRDQDRPVRRLTDVPPGLSERQAKRKRLYFAIMGLCLVLIVLAWNVVRLYSTTAAVAMSAVAAVLPPVAAVVANWHGDR